MLFSNLGDQILGFDHMPELYSQDPEFSSIFTNCQRKPQGDYYLNQGYLFKEENSTRPFIHIENFL